MEAPTESVGGTPILQTSVAMALWQGISECAQYVNVSLNAFSNLWDNGGTMQVYSEWHLNLLSHTATTATQLGECTMTSLNIFPPPSFKTIEGEGTFLPYQYLDSVISENANFGGFSIPVPEKYHFFVCVHH